MSGTRDNDESGPRANEPEATTSASPTADASLAGLLAAQASSFKELADSIKGLSGSRMQGNDFLDDVNWSEMMNPDGIIGAMGNAQGRDTLSEDGYGEDIQNMLTDLSAPTTFGPKISKISAESFRAISQFTVTREILDEWKQTYKTPENCQELITPTVNPEIWSGLPLREKTNDVKLQALQHNLTRAQIAHAHIMDRILKIIPEETLPPLLKLLLDASKSISLANQEINQRRRQALKPLLRPEYAALGSQRIPVTKYLCGDQLEQSMKEVKASSNILKSTTLSLKSRYHPYRRPFENQSRGNHLNYNRPLYPPHQQQNRSVLWNANQYQRGFSRGKRTRGNPPFTASDHVS